MTDFAKFGIELVDNVSKPSQKAADALENLERKVGGVGSGVDQLDGRLKRLMHSRAFEMIAGRANQMAGAMEGLAMRGIGAAADAAKQLVTGVVSAAVSADTATRAMSSLTGSQEAGNDAYQRAVKLSQDLGMNLDSATHSMQEMLAMQFKVGEAEEMIKIAADLRAITGEAHSAERAMRAITQIKAKGKLQAEELVGQLSEAGVSTSLVYKQLSTIYGKTEDQVRKMLQGGKIDAETGIRAIKQAIMAKVHEHAAGEAAMKFADSSLSGLWGRVQQAPRMLYAKVAEALPDLIPRLQVVVKQILGFIDKLDVKKISQFADAVITMLITAVPLVKEFATGFIEGFKEMTTEFGKLGLAEDSLKSAKEFGRAFADALNSIVKAMMWIGGALKPLMNDTGMWLLGGLYLATKLGGALSSVASILNLFGGGGAGAARAVGAVAGGLGGGGGAAGGAGAALGGLGISAGVGTALAVGGGLALAGGIGYAGYSLYQANEEKKLNEQLRIKAERSRLEAAAAERLEYYDTQLSLTGVERNQVHESQVKGGFKASNQTLAEIFDERALIADAIAQSTAGAPTRTGPISQALARPGGQAVQQQNTAQVEYNFYLEAGTKDGQLTPDGARELAKTVKQTQDGGDFADMLASQMGQFLAAR